MSGSRRKGLTRTTSHGDATTGPGLDACPAARRPRALARRWDGALVPEIALRLSLKNTMRHHELPDDPAKASTSASPRQGPAVGSYHCKSVGKKWQREGGICWFQWEGSII